MPTVVPCLARDRYHFQGVQFPLQGHGYHEPYLALCRYLGKIILLAFGWRILSLFMRAWVRLYPLTSTCCLVEEQEAPCYSPVCCLHKSASTARQEAFVLWVEDGEQWVGKLVG